MCRQSLDICYSSLMSTSILYEHPLNERMRVFLRLEHLFLQVSHFQNGHSIWDSHASVFALIEILSILDRSDIRSEVLKELDRHLGGLSRLLDTPAVDRHRLDNTLKQLNSQVQKIQQLPNKLGSEIRDNDLLNSVRQRTLIMGGTCGFDLPAYHCWLNQPPRTKAKALSQWISTIIPLQESIELLLTLTRNSTLFERQCAESGFFQRSLDTQNPCQLLRIALPVECDAYPEVSGNKHRANVRFLAYTESGRPKQISYNLEFDMSCCSI
jgi:cell division protein ZapD